LNDKIWRSLGLTDGEYALIKKQMGREPNEVELNMYSVMWSEHCSYKHSRSMLKIFPTSGSRIIQGPGENAGVVDIGKGWAAVFKIESHNHPSAIEPYQGAATGVGGILRDIFTMGAQPVAFLNSLRFGPPDNDRTCYIFDNVVAGIGGYGNCVGIPTVGGEVYFEQCYRGNPLVNVMCVGVMPLEKLTLGRADAPGNLVILVGALTGRDGIHGVTFASEELSNASEERRPAVQVGDPFLGKLLLEATLEAIEEKAVVGVQDLGGAGLTCALTETASRAGTGMEIDLDRVPLREAEMEDFEILTSESQERMLLIVEPKRKEEVKNIFSRWELEMAVLGRVTDDGLVTVYHKGKKVVSVPAWSVAGGSPEYAEDCAANGGTSVCREVNKPVTGIENCGEVLLNLLADPDIASKEWVWQRYDYQVRTSTVQGPGGDAAVIKIRQTGQALAMTVDGNGRYCHLDPSAGGKMAVMEATRNLSCVGAEPVGITDCLNFGNPEKEEIYSQFKATVEGMAEACRVLETPVVGGNVSFYNEVAGQAIYPTPVVGAVGLLDRYEQQGTADFKKPGDWICLLGSPAVSLGGSQLQKSCGGELGGLLSPVNLELEKRLQSLVRCLVRSRLVASAHDLAEGGLAVALAESCLPNNIGAAVEVTGQPDKISSLFGEGPSRILISTGGENLENVKVEAEKAGVPLTILGKTGGKVLLIRSGDDIILKLEISSLRSAYEEVFSCLMK